MIPRPEISLMHRTCAILVVAAAVLAACNNTNPAEVRTETTTFPIVATWTATSAPVAPATVTGALVVKQRLGYHEDVTFTVTGPPNQAFQWRVFKRDCTVNTAAINNTAATGLVLFSTTQAYPDITLDATGKATVTTEIAGWLDSLTAYSVRIRPTATTTFNGVNPAACGNLKYAPSN
jgi:hypothetical protein